jgi:hypothetical protein
MRSTKPPRTEHEKEYIAELLKERIYATLALLAVLISIDTNHSSPLHAIYIICGTIISLWAASIVATQMSRRLIFPGQLDHVQETHHQLRRHAPMLASLLFPLFMIILAMVHITSLEVAINISIISALILLAGWSIGSARSLNAKKFPTFVLVAIELAIGLSIVGLKVLIGH